MSNKKDGPIALPGAVYASLNDAPAHLRVLDGGRLPLEAINQINARAVELGEWITLEGVGQFHNPDEAGARAEYRTDHHVEAGIWVDGAQTEVNA